MSQQRAFTDIPLPTRSEKPRNTGLTMMIDWGLPLGQQKDVLESASDYIDMAKVAATIPALLPEEVLKKKLAIYSGAGIGTSQGGLYTEYAYVHGKTEPLFAEIARLGFTAVEISDNLLNWSLDEKRQTIRTAIEGFGLKVLGEVGRKGGAMTDDEIIADLEVCFDASVAAVFIEAYELFSNDQIRGELISEIARRFPAEKVIYELPVDVLPGVTREFKHKVCSWMVKEFGSDVNLANVEWHEVLFTEMVRRKAGDNIEVPGA